MLKPGAEAALKAALPRDDAAYMALGLILAAILAIVVLAVASRSGEQVSMPQELSAEQAQAEILRCLTAGQKIQAIKIYRQLHGVGLREAKEAVEELARTLPAT